MHKDKRTNIPTQELRGFVAEDQTKVLYPRDPSLDPQLVWKGKDEQDSGDLEVPVTPIYIQEKIHPKAIIENLRKTAAEGQPEPELSLFDDFNGIDFDELVDFYAHEQNWSNRMILGDSLAVMASLAEKEQLKGKVQMTYLDPPYGIKFGSNWQVSTRKRDVKDGSVDDVTRQPEQVKAFRDTWELGIHSYLTYMRDRLVVTRELLSESGSVFVQIGDENVHLVRSLLDEVFGSENYVSGIVFRKKLMPLGAKTLERMHDHILWYARDADHLKYRPLFTPSVPDPRARWTGVEEPTGKRRPLTKDERDAAGSLPPGFRVYSTVSQWAPSYSEANRYDFEFEGKTYSPPTGQCWVTSKEKMTALARLGRLVVEGGAPRYVMFHDDFPFKKLTNPWSDTAPAQDQRYVVQTNPIVVARCMLLSTDPGDLVLDPTCGSGTTANVAEAWGRRWITVDTSRVALTLARTRLMAARFPYYLLADSSEGAEKQAQVEQAPPTPGPFGGDIRKGFVYKTVLRTTLKSVANNPDIKEGMSPADIAAAVTRRAEKEVLYDQPYEDKNRLRVTGPFTMESLSPHRSLGQQDVPEAESSADLVADAGRFEASIIDNLRKAGVQNTKKGEKLVFDRLDAYAGLGWIHAEGQYTDAEGIVKRVAVSIGPEQGTVGPQQIKEAAKEAVRGTGFDLLIVAGFAFDPMVSEEARQYGNLHVEIVRMNPDLAMGDELLKKTGAGNLFTIFGEPDLVVKDEGDGLISVELLGLDVYDPTTGEVRASSVDDIACWFIDTEYNAESFFVRHAYFTGADRPYEKLKKALKAEIDEEAWSSLYSTKSRPFPKPPTGRIAVKVINHYGDEVLQVYET